MVKGSLFKNLRRSDNNIHRCILYRAMHMSADLYYAVELISVIKASRVITIEGKNQSPTVTSNTHNTDDPLPHP